jgi:hypothetical protein
MTEHLSPRGSRAAVLAALPVLFAAVLVLVLARPAAAQGWPALSDEEKAMTDCPQQPGAEAIWLRRETVTDHESMETRVFKRLKILKESGRDRANIEIPYYSGIQKVDRLEVRHILPQGGIVPFDGQVFDKTAVRYRRLRVGLKTFAVPDIRVGSIIEFRYKIVPDERQSSNSDDEDLADTLLTSGSKPEEGGLPKSREFLSFPAAHWEVQDSLFTCKARFEYIPFPYIHLLFNGPCRISWSSHRLGDIKPTIKGNRILLELENIPAFVAEEYMTSEQAEEMSVDVYYLDRRISESDDFWKRESRAWQKAAERFIGDPSKVAARAQELVGDAQDPVARLQKLYEGAQRIRNLSYESGLTKKRKKEEKIRRNNSVADVLERGYGVRSDITRAFVALARAAGFEAELSRATTRDDKLFSIKLMSFYGQMDSEVALVKLGDRKLLFDPATPFCPFGLAHWSRTNTAAVRFANSVPTFFTTTVYPPEMGLTVREIALKIGPDGALAGTVKTTYAGHEALVRRLDHIHDDAEARKKDLEKELADVLPIGAAVSMTAVENADNSAPSLIARFEVSIPGLVTAAGEKTLLPVSPLTGTAQYPFRQTARNYPVYFPFPYREFDDIVLTLPEGQAAEVRPAPRKTDNDFSTYSLVCAQENPTRLHIQRDLVIKKSYYAVDQYPALKAFFDAVRAGDEEQIVLTTVKKQPR